MLEISTNGNIKVNKGDTFDIPLTINLKENIFDPKPFPWKAGDKILFHVMEGNKPFEFPLIRKEYLYEDLDELTPIIIHFNHRDTCWLSAGIYSYEVKLIRPNKGDDSSDSDENLDDCKGKYIYLTLIPRKKFVLL